MNQTKVSQERWQQAQAAELEYWRDQGADGDDWNQWWFDKFEGYKVIPREDVESLIEVGCGPFAKNTELFTESCVRPPNVTLNDPLIYHYASAGKNVRGLLDYAGAKSNGLQLEEIDVFCDRFDAIICINVLDHVQDVARCFDAMHSVLRSGGYLILGQDLTSDEDCRQCPDNLTDAKHPILMDYETLRPYLQPYQPVFSDILPREAGRNPKAHYGTLLFIGKKR